MKRFQDVLHRLPPYLLSSIASVLTVLQIVIALLLPSLASQALQWAGWICLWSAGIFGLLPIFTFRKKGGVPEGESYIKTSVLVDTGIYAVVRHPQGGTAWLLINLGIMLISCHWICIVLGLVSIVLVYADTFKLDQTCIEKFGSAYQRYMEKVPRVNVVAGIFRLLKKSG